MSKRSLALLSGGIVLVALLVFALTRASVWTPKVAGPYSVHVLFNEYDLAHFDSRDYLAEKVAVETDGARTVYKLTGVKQLKERTDDGFLYRRESGEPLPGTTNVARELRIVVDNENSLYNPGANVVHIDSLATRDGKYILGNTLHAFGHHICNGWPCESSEK